MGTGSATLDAIRSAMITAGIGVAANPSATDWMIYEHFLEDGTPNHDRAIALYETPGLEPLQTWLITYPSFQVVVRGAQDEAAEVRQKQQDIFALLHCGNVALGTDFVYCFAKQSAPIPMGRDEKRRPKSAWNYRTMRNTPGALWILLGGKWNDSGRWVDSARWED